LENHHSQQSNRYIQLADANTNLQFGYGQLTCKMNSSTDDEIFKKNSIKYQQNDKL
jgi:hypothetical protein